MKNLSIFSIVSLVAGAGWLFLNRKPVNDEAEIMPGTSAHNGRDQRASALYWGQIKYFSKDEFNDELENLDAQIILTLEKLREKVGRIMISPAEGAITRKKPGSMHDISNGRLSLAIDVMPIDVSLKKFYDAARQLPEIGGIGLYPDWRPYPGAHIDLRKRKNNGLLATWAGVNVDGEQVYSGIDKVLTA